eukprot:6181186-Pleurochrysis_carterae.AAC.1
MFEEDGVELIGEGSSPVWLKTCDDGAVQCAVKGEWKATLLTQKSSRSTAPMHLRLPSAAFRSALFCFARSLVGVFIVQHLCAIALPFTWATMQSRLGHPHAYTGQLTAKEEVYYLLPVDGRAINAQSYLKQKEAESKRSSIRNSALIAQICSMLNKAVSMQDVQNISIARPAGKASTYETRQGKM